MPKPLTHSILVGMLVCVYLMCLCVRDAWASEHPQSQEKAEAKQEKRTAKKSSKLERRSEKAARREQKVVEQQRRQEAYKSQLQEIEIRKQELQRQAKDIGNRRGSDPFSNVFPFGLGILIGVFIGKFLPRKRKE